MLQLSPTTYANALLKEGAGKADDSSVSKAVLNTIQSLLVSATNTPVKSAPELELDQQRLGAKTAPAISKIEQLWNGQAAGAISLVMMGESHNNADDRTRANDFIQRLQLTAPVIAVLERALPYTPPANAQFTIREDILTTTSIGNWAIINGLSAAQRSMIVAGYLVLVTASGNQNDITNFAIFFGENHSDIAKHFEYFARHTNAAYLAKRSRKFLLVSSNAT